MALPSGGDAPFGEGPSVTWVALETVLWGARELERSAAGLAGLEEALRARGDLDRLRELEVRFGCRLFAAAERAATARDRGWAAAERRMLASGSGYVESGEDPAGGLLASPPGRLAEPWDHVRGPMVLDAAAVRRLEREQGRVAVPGAAFVLRVGSYPPRPWYVEPGEREGGGLGGAVLVPWQAVRLGRGTDVLGEDADGRTIRAVRGDVESVHPAGPAPSEGALVGDVEQGVWGELRRTARGAWLVLGEPPNGRPPAEPALREMVAGARWSERGRLDFSCYNRPRELTRGACEARGGVWDRPCTRDHECPYFSADARGGCVRGFCEMPLGVNNIAFTVPEGRPVCRSCPPEDPRCCGPGARVAGDFAWR